MKINPLFYLPFSLIFAIISCDDAEQEQMGRTEEIASDSTSSPTVEEIIIDSSCIWDDYLTGQGLVDIKSVSKSIVVDLKYSSSDNFIQKDIYGCLERCYLQPEAAYQLNNAQILLQSNHPGLSLLIWDGVRPRSIQQYMWDLLDMPEDEKGKYVGNPKNGSMHNYGAAVDVTIIDQSTDSILDMGTEFDHFGVESWPLREKELLKDGRLNQLQVDNRQLLRSVMTQSGFQILQSEWWHFTLNKDSVRANYAIIEGIN